MDSDKLLLPQTPFEMRGNLKEKEPKLISKWEEMKLYEKMLLNRKDAPEYMLHDGPPYANGDIHCGHMLNRLLKDFVVRFKAMQGYSTPFVFGFDTHGLPIEVKLSKSGIDRHKMSVVDFRKKCEEYALTQVERQMEEIKRLGVLGDYGHPYLTLQKEFEAEETKVFADLALRGLIYKGVKPVYWSPSSESALAEAEIEYHDVPAKTLYVAFPIIDGGTLLDKDVKALIWTTTPWTIPANLAITINPRFDYGVYDTGSGKVLCLVSLSNALKQLLGFEKMELLKSFKGKELEGLKAAHPLYGRESPFLCADFVTEESGTGLVHTAPDHGGDDFNVCFKYGIKPFCPVDEKGIVHSLIDPRIDGQDYEKTNDIVIEELIEKGALLKEIDIIHSYPHDWRTGKPLIFRATPQWFASIKPIREELLEAIDKIEWDPIWGKTKMQNMVKDRSDWCISRQRAWGVPIPIIYNEDGSPILKREVFDHIASIIREKGSGAWYELSEKELLPEGYSDPASPNGGFYKETDIMDVWFDSGSSWRGVLLERGMKYPADLYLEGNDQYRGWFNASLTLSVACKGLAPFKKCLTHGWVMDENWQKMSKSKGNGIDPSKVANELGADLLRLFVSSVDYRSEVKMSESIIKGISDSYRKIRNTFRFMLGNLQDGEGRTYVHEDKEYSYLPEDRFILAKLEKVKNEVLSRYEKFDFAVARDQVVSFLVNDLSSFYLDISKDPLYCDAPDSTRRKAIQDVLYKCTDNLSKLLCPIIPFTMEEVYSHFPKKDKKEALQLEDFPTESHEYTKEDLNLYERFMDVREEALKILEEGRAKGLYGSNLDAVLSLEVIDEAVKDMLDSLDEEERARLFGVAQLVYGKNGAMASQEAICFRCRRHTKLENGLCKRCAGE